MQGVTKIISTFFRFGDLKLKLGQLGLQKNGLILNFQEVKIFSKRDEKNPTCYKRAPFLIIFTKKVLGEFFSNLVLKGV